MYRKSSYSLHGGQCVEVDPVPYRKSSYSESSNCVEVGHDWRKSGYSAYNGDCVEAASAAPGVYVRDSKDVTIPPLRFTGVSWGTFLQRVKTEF